MRNNNQKINVKLHLYRLNLNMIDTVFMVKIFELIEKSEFVCTKFLSVVEVTFFLYYVFIFYFKNVL